MDSHVRALYKIDPEPEGPAQARQIIAEELSARLPARVVDDIKPMVSELLTNPHHTEVWFERRRA
jgi:hypothetical protein